MTNPYKKLTYKDVMQALEISERTAKRYLSDIKKQYNIKTVLGSHFLSYFMIP